MSKEELLDLVINKGLTIKQLIDTVVEYNGIVGVGLITLGDQLKEYCTDKINTSISYE
ncbi:MAG: hypothetical protein M0R03_23275 [Novosphingobium sp.]|nr:hypothetical protein [Novosphingobium sp.]